MHDPVVTLDELTKIYDGFQLGPMSLEVEPGYVVAVVGPNGSGKSTLFRILMSLVHADQGDVRVLGHRYGGDDVSVKERIGYVPERSRGYDQMRVADLGAFYSYWYPDWDSAEYNAALTGMDLERDKQFGALSKGMQRRVAFALAMASRSDLLLLDELMDGVDPFARRAMLGEIARYMEPGDRTVVFATHNMDDVRRLADYVVFLVDGAFLGMYEKDALLDDWRRLWLDRAPNPGTPGVAAVGGGRPVELVSNNWRETAAALQHHGIVIERNAPLDLTEILEQVMKREVAPLAGEELPLVQSG